MPNLNQDLITDPQRFLSTYPLNLLKMNKMTYQGADCGVQATTKTNQLGFFDIRATDQFSSTKEVAVVSVATTFAYGTNTPLQGYYADYFGGAMQDARGGPVSVAVPKALPPHQFVFTGQLNGCSVIVQDPGGANLMVTHDAHPNSSGGYAHVVAKFDFDDYKFDQKVMYGGSLQETGFAAVVMYRDPRMHVWALACQKLNVDLRTEQVSLRALLVKLIV